MKLYVFPVAPNPTKVRLYVAEKRLGGAAIDVEEVRVDLLRREQVAPEHLERNPLGKLPVLEVEEGVYLTESLPIVQFLEEGHPEPAMIGRTPLERAQTLTVERIVEQGVLGPVAQIVHATESPLGLPPNPAVADHFRERLPRTLRLLEERLADGRPFLMGDRPTVADCTLQAALQFARFGRIELDPSLLGLAAWDGRFRERPSAREVLVL